MRSPKEISLSAKIIETLEGLASAKADAPLSDTTLEGTRLILADAEIQATQEYANNVSIMRLGINDHGPVHMHCVTLNAIIMMDLLRKAGVKTSLEKEEAGTFDDSLLAVIFASMLHDLGMTIGRHEHETHSTYLALPIMDRLLAALFPDNIKRKVVIRSLALEGISGHMGNRTIHSLEAGVIQVADGCDMTKGRARIPMALNVTPRAGSIHQYSANSIEEVRIQAGAEKPIRIEVSMSSEVGLFQIEEVLLTKIAASTAKPYIELHAQVQDSEPKQYL